MENMTFTGAIEDVKKSSHFNLSALGSSTPLPDEYETPYTGEIYHQHQTPSCGAHAGTYVKNIQEGRNHSPAYLWKAIKQIDNIPPQDGTSMEMIFKALTKKGVCSLDLLPNDTLQNLKDYTDPSVITPAMDEDASKSKIGAYAFIFNPTFEQIKRAIYDHKVVIMRVAISADWWTPSWKGKDILPLKKNYPDQGGHFVVVNGFTKDNIKGLNEWGETWGDKGHFTFDESYLPRITYIGTCFDAADNVDVVFTRTLKQGAHGTDVGLLQLYLKELGYFPKDQAITKSFGPITRKSVMKLQQINGLLPDGIFGKKSQEKLISLIK